jgi:hypothetical protein
VRRLPADAIESIRVQSAVEESFEALGHLAPGLRLLYLVLTGFSDAVLPTAAEAGTPLPR